MEFFLYRILLQFGIRLSRSRIPTWSTGNVYFGSFGCKTISCNRRIAAGIEVRDGLQEVSGTYHRRTTCHAPRVISYSAVPFLLVSLRGVLLFDVFERISYCKTIFHSSHRLLAEISTRPSYEYIVNIFLDLPKALFDV